MSLFQNRNESTGIPSSLYALLKTWLINWMIIIWM